MENLMCCNIYNSCCLDVLGGLSDNGIDAVITDSPYGLRFMDKHWDYDMPSVEIWKECLRVLKPGGYLLAFAGTRTYHRMACRVEDAGFEIRDMITWIYGSGFPKSLNIGKAIDKKNGVERVEIIGKSPYEGRRPNSFGGKRNGDVCYGDYNAQPEMPVYAPATEEAKQWEGWGTALKPAFEPVVMARKPLSEKTVAENVLRWGTGGINVDGCRVGVESLPAQKAGQSTIGTFKRENMTTPERTGRFPANIIHDGSDEVVGMFPYTKSGKVSSSKDSYDGVSNTGFLRGVSNGNNQHGDSGSAARFFYCAKSSSRERNSGLDSYLTVKYNISISGENILCVDNTAVVRLLRKVMSESTQNFSIGEYGENIMVQCHKDSLSIILTEINRTIESKILHSLMRLLTNESIVGVRFVTENGGNHVEGAESLKRFLLDITKGNQELALGVNNAVLKMLLKIRNEEEWKPSTNFHATVKPIKLMEYLVTLVTKEGATVLDPFMGSGTTGIACKNLNRKFIGIEKEKEYFEIAEKRIANGIKTRKC